MDARIMKIARHRMGTDGQGVSTLVAFWGCPLHCRYCINNFCHDPEYPYKKMNSEEVVQRLLLDEIYYRMTGGGIVFGGGEPLLNSAFIREVAGFLEEDIPIRVETSLNVPWEAVESLFDIVDEWIIDIKDMNPEIYYRYTGVDNRQVVDNCRRLSEKIGSSGADPKRYIVFRIPLIPEFNSQEDVTRSVSQLQAFGGIDLFEYKTKASYDKLLDEQ